MSFKCGGCLPLQPGSQLSYTPIFCCVSAADLLNIADDPPNVNPLFCIFCRKRRPGYRPPFQLVDKPSLWGQRFIYAGGARGGKARLESDQMSRKALPCKACVERSDYFRAARRHKNNDIITGCRKKPEAFSTACKEAGIPASFSALLFTPSACPSSSHSCWPPPCPSERTGR